MIQNKDWSKRSEVPTTEGKRKNALWNETIQKVSLGKK